MTMRKTSENANMNSPKQSYDDAAELVRQWQAKLNDAQQFATAGVSSDVLINPIKATDLAYRRAQAADEAALCREALQAALSLKETAAWALLAQEADELEPAAGNARAALAAYDAETDRLLVALEGHTGQAWRPQVGTASTVVGRVELLRELGRIEARQGALRAASAGEDPRQHLTIEDLPASLLPGGVLPHPAVIEHFEDKARYEAEEESWRQVVAARQVEVNQAAAILGIDAPVALERECDFDQAVVDLPVWRGGINGNPRIPAVPSEFDTIVRRCGVHAANEALNAWLAQHRGTDAPAA
jgi:hypothetical protein